MNTQKLLRPILLCFLCLFGVGWWLALSKIENSSIATQLNKPASIQQAGDEDTEARFQMMRRGSDAFLLGSPQVRRELNLSHENSLRIIQLLNEAARLNHGGVMTSEGAAQLKKERQETDPDALRERALEQLSLAQLERLQQISNQGAAPFLLNNSSLALKIGATPQQIQRVQKQQEQEFARYQETLKSLDNVHSLEVKSAKRLAAEKVVLERERQRTQLRIDYLSRCETALANVLTREQKKRWRDLLGKPFTETITYDTKSHPLS